MIRARMTVFHRLCCIGLLATGALAQPLPAATASNDGLRDERSLAFGATIVDIALTLDEAAKHSLVAAPEAGVAGRMSFRDASGADKTYDVTLNQGPTPDVYTWLLTKSLP